MTKMELLFIKEMFDSIAPKYDFLNRFLSLGQDLFWRKEMVKAAHISNKTKVLDVACGTCDVALEIKKQTNKSTKIFGVDFSHKMLALGKKKIHCYDSNIYLTAGNALNLPFKNNLFNTILIAFGIRNIINRKKVLIEFYNSLKIDGKIIILELTSPEHIFLKKLYMVYFKKILPFFGGIFSKNHKAYQYLQSSVIKFPEAHSFVDIMKQAEFSKIKWKNMTFGIVTLFVGTKTR
ncbi:MAG: bifunctional demethylmenaquinone methyltransferase/2-methoxy-6-polyprenyl-1,4-benzoquinol methylase [Desulfobacteraceae bacterium 4572_130]|nr:MAG: bifunctional demethylmenaquinone methyltransferase/2-methoxy-6-polyprenyl-1,4-benzoquinol methylase [Desulfobacteraceae bacterium 4572_130]